MESVNQAIKFLIGRFLSGYGIEASISEIAPGHVTARIDIESWKAFDRRLGLDTTAISDFPDIPGIDDQVKLSKARAIAVHVKTALDPLVPDRFSIKTAASVDGNDAVIDIVARKR